MNMINLIHPKDCPCPFCDNSDKCDEVRGCSCSVCSSDTPIEDLDE